MKRQLFRMVLLGVLSAFALQSQATPVPAAEQLQHRIETYLSQRYQGMPVRLVFKWPQRRQTLFPMETVDSLIIRYPRGRLPRGNTVVTVDAFWNGKIVRRFNYTLKVRVFQKVWQSRERITARTLIKPEDFEQTEREITHLYGEPVTDIREIAGQITRRSLAPGNVLTRDMLKPAPLISRGDQVELVYRQSTVSIKMRARALQNGAEGEVIWFFFPESRKRFKGRVITRDQAAFVRN